MSILQFQRVPRIAAYAAAAAVVTAGLFAAESAYRWYQASNIEIAAPLTDERPFDGAPPALAEAPTAHAATQMPAEIPEPQLSQAEERAPEQPSIAQAPHPIGGPNETPIGDTPSIASGPSDTTAGTIVAPANSTIANAAPAPVPPVIGATTARRAPQQARRQPSAERQPAAQAKRQPARILAAEPKKRERTATRRTVQTAAKPAPRPQKPDVYYETDRQLGFAPQLRARTCNPATGQMPMQCYYPREDREKFPAKAGN